MDVMRIDRAGQAGLPAKTLETKAGRAASMPIYFGSFYTNGHPPAQLAPQRFCPTGRLCRQTEYLANQWRSAEFCSSIEADFLLERTRFGATRSNYVRLALGRFSVTGNSIISPLPIEKYNYRYR